MLALARERSTSALSVDLLSRNEGLPRKFLEAIMFDLRVAGLVQATRGNRGGYALTSPPSQISLGRIIRAVDGGVAPTPCVSASSYSRCACADCDEEAWCAVRPMMKEIREAISRVIDRKTLAALVHETEPLRRAVTWSSIFSQRTLPRKWTTAYSLCCQD